MSVAHTKWVWDREIIANVERYRYLTLCPLILTLLNVVADVTVGSSPVTCHMVVNQRVSAETCRLTSEEQGGWAHPLTKPPPLTLSALSICGELILILWVDSLWAAEQITVSKSVVVVAIVVVVVVFAIEVVFTSASCSTCSSTWSAACSLGAFIPAH